MWGKNVCMPLYFLVSITSICRACLIQQLEKCRFIFMYASHPHYSGFVANSEGRAYS